MAEYSFGEINLPSSQTTLISRCPLKRGGVLKLNAQQSSNEFICKILHKGNLLKIQHCQNHRQRPQKDTEKRGKFSDTQSVAKFDTPVAFKGKLPANERRTKDILLCKIPEQRREWKFVQVSTMQAWSLQIVNERSRSSLKAMILSVLCLFATFWATKSRD